MNKPPLKKSLPLLAPAIILAITALFLSFSGVKIASAAVGVGILPYRLICQNISRYSYVADSIPVLMASDLSSESIIVANNSDIKDFINKNRFTSFSTGNLQKISKHFGLDYLIFGNLVGIGKVFDLQTNIYSSSQNSVVYTKSETITGVNFIINDINRLSGKIKQEIGSLSASSAVPSIPQAKTSLAIQTPSPVTPAVSANQGNEFIKRYNYAGNGQGLARTEAKKYVIHAMAAGNFFNPGLKAVVATDHRIIIYSLTYKGGLTKLAGYHLAVRSNVIYVGIYKMSGGKSFIVVTRARLGVIESFLLGYESGKITKVTGNYNLFLRVMDIGGKRVIVGQEPVSVIPSGRFFNDYVIGQNNYPIGQFGGQTNIYGFDVTGSSLVKSTEIKFLKGMTLYGTVYGNYEGSGVNYLVALSNSGNLMVIDGKGNAVYTGSQAYGGSTLTVKVPSMFGVRSSSRPNGFIYNVPAQMTGFSYAGKDNVVVIKNFNETAFLKYLNYYSKTAIYSLVWDKVGFFPAWNTKPIAGYSAGFSILRKGSQVYLIDAVVANPGSAFTSPKSYIAIYRISK